MNQEKFILVYNDSIGDISIFSLEEWKEVIEISLYFREAVFYANSLSDYEYSNKKEFIDSAYFFYHSDFCKYATPLELEWKIINFSDYCQQKELELPNKLRNWLENSPIKQKLMIIKQEGIIVDKWKLEEKNSKYLNT